MKSQIAILLGVIAAFAIVVAHFAGTRLYEAFKDTSLYKWLDKAVTPKPKAPKKEEGAA